MESGNQLEELILRCQAGERTAFEALFEQYQPRLKYFLRRLDSNGWIDDLTQEIWLTVIRKIHQLKQPLLFKVWFYRIARNKVYSGTRKKDRVVRLSEDVEITEFVEEPTFTLEEAECMHQAMGRLKAPHREVLSLCFLEQMPYQAIAEVIGCNIGTVRSRIHYAKKALRREMERHNGPE